MDDPLQKREGFGLPSDLIFTVIKHGFSSSSDKIFKPSKVNPSHTKKAKLDTLYTTYFLKHILRLTAWVFFELNFNISFCQISNLSLYLHKNEFRNNF